MLVEAGVGVAVEEEEGEAVKDDEVGTARERRAVGAVRGSVEDGTVL
jgi:hypothetical protein